MRPVARRRWFVSLLLSSLAAAAQAATFTWPGAAPCATTLASCLASVPYGSTVAIAVDGEVFAAPSVSRETVLTAAPGFEPELPVVFLSREGGEVRDLTIRGPVWIQAGQGMKRAVVAGNRIQVGDSSADAAIRASNTQFPNQPRLDLQILDNEIESAEHGIHLCD